MTYQHYHSDPSGWRDDCEGCQAEAHPPRAEAHVDTARPLAEVLMAHEPFPHYDDEFMDLAARLKAALAAGAPTDE